MSTRGSERYIQQKAHGDVMPLRGYEALQSARRSSVHDNDKEYSFAPSEAYVAYHRMHKMLVGESGGSRLQAIASRLCGEDMPEYLDVAGWAAAEASLVMRSQSTVDRMKLLSLAEDCWERSLNEQEVLNHSKGFKEYGNDLPYRTALNLAFLPMMKAMVAGNITDAVREHVFTDTLAITQSSRLQRQLAYEAGDRYAASDLTGFEYECSALLGLLYLNDPRYIPLPSLARSGTGHDYPDQTHDIMVVNQHWGEILRVTPVEIKARATLRDIDRYNALIVRGKMHLSYQGGYSPEHTQEAFAAHYEGNASPKQIDTVHYATSTLKNLLQLYKKGSPENRTSSRTRFHAKEEVVKQYPELSLDRAKK